MTEQILFMPKLLEQLSTSLLSCGSCDDDMYIRLIYGEIGTFLHGTDYEYKMFIPITLQGLKICGEQTMCLQKAMCLQTVQLPLKLRGQGNFSKILDVLEERADRDNMVFVIGPLLEQENGRTILPRILEKRGYLHIQPCSRYRPKN